MKKKIVSKIAGAMLVVLMVLLAPAKVTAQNGAAVTADAASSAITVSEDLKFSCGPFVFKNQTNCTIQITISYNCSGVPCAGNGPITIPPGGGINVPVCPCAQSGCFISVTITSMNGMPVIPAATPVTWGGTGTYTPPSSCPGALGTINFTTSTCIIK